MKKAKTPGIKSYARDARLALAPAWIAGFTGKRLVKGYAKHFGVDMFCALAELKLLGVPIDEEYEKNLRASIESNIQLRQKKKGMDKLGDDSFEQEFGHNGQFAFIAGFTENGAPYGTTWEEKRREDEAMGNAPENSFLPAKPMDDSAENEKG